MILAIQKKENSIIIKLSEYKDVNYTIFFNKWRKSLIKIKINKIIGNINDDIINNIVYSK